MYHYPAEISCIVITVDTTRHGSSGGLWTLSLSPSYPVTGGAPELLSHTAAFHLPRSAGDSSTSGREGGLFLYLLIGTTYKLFPLARSKCWKEEPEPQ